MPSRYKPMNAAELMDRVFDVYKRSFFSQIGFAAIVLGISFVLVFVLMMLLMFIIIFSFIGLAAGDSSEITMLVAVFVSIAAVYLPLYMIYKATAESGHILLSRQAFCQRRVKLPVKQLLGVLLRVLSATLAQVILAIPFLAVCGACFYFLFALDADLAFEILISPVLLIAIMVVGTVVYVIYSNIFSLAIPVAVFEKRAFFGTVARSWQLVRGEFWKILGIRMIWMVVTYIFSVSAQGAWALAMELFAIHPAFFVLGNMATMVATMLISLLTMPLSGIFPAVIYFNQRIKREGMDIELCIEGLSP